MATTAITLINTVLRRIRDSSGVGTTTALARSFLERCERTLNTGTGQVITTDTLTTTAGVTLYPIFTNKPNVARIVGVREGDRDLTLIDWRDLALADTGWLKRIGDRFEIASLIGRDLLAIWPAKDEASSVTLIYAKLTDALTTDATPLDLPDEELVTLADLLEAVLSIRTRALPEANAAMDRVEQALAPRDIVPGGTAPPVGSRRRARIANRFRRRGTA